MPKAKTINGYFKEMLKAKKENKASFVYKGRTYKRTKTKTGLVTYKK